MYFTAVDETLTCNGEVATECFLKQATDDSANWIRQTVSNQLYF